MLASTVKWKFMCKTSVWKEESKRFYIYWKLACMSEWRVRRGGHKYMNIIRSHPQRYMLSPHLAISLMRKKKKNHKSISLHYTGNTIQYLYSPVISYHGVVCKYGFEGTSSICSYTGTWNKYFLLQDSFRKTIKSILTSHSSTHKFLMLPDNFSFMSAT